jgi:hypothetical protein
MSAQLKKRGSKAADSDDVIQAAIQDGLSEDKSDINNEPVHRELADERHYKRMMGIGYAYGCPQHRVTLRNEY